MVCLALVMFSYFLITELILTLIIMQCFMIIFYRFSSIIRSRSVRCFICQDDLIPELPERHIFNHTGIGNSRSRTFPFQIETVENPPLKENTKDLFYPVLYIRSKYFHIVQISRVRWGGKRGDVSKKNRNSFHKTQLIRMKYNHCDERKIVFIIHFLVICKPSKLRLPEKKYLTISRRSDE